MTTNRKPSRLGKAIAEMAGDQHRLGLIDDTTLEKITVRHLGAAPLKAVKPISADDIRRTREHEHLSQAALARYLDVTAGFVSQLERGTREAKGPVRVLLNVIRSKGLEALS